MNHLSFFWLSENKSALMNGLKSEFAQLVARSVCAGHIILPPIPDIVLRIQQLAIKKETSIFDITKCLIEDPSLAATVIRVANSVIFSRNITCIDIQTAVSRLGIDRVRDIVTAQSIEQLKQSANLSKECNQILTNSAATSRELAATMLLVTKAIQNYSPTEYRYLKAEKALLVGLLADIGLFCLVNEYHLYLERGNYLDQNLALQVFQASCSNASKLVLKNWMFDEDFIEVAINKQITNNKQEISYLDIARIANHLLMFRKQDKAIDDHHIEINVASAEAMYELSCLDDKEFDSLVANVMSTTGL